MSRRLSLSPGDRFGEFLVEGEVGRGAMGVVYSAVQVGLGRRVALKLIADDLADDLDFRQRFEREAVALASLDSRHVVTVYTAGTIDGHLYIATQLVEGGDAGAVLASRGPFAPDEALGIAEQVASGLVDAHRIGLVHRDVKPGNVLLRQVDGRWDAYLCDFGVVRSDDSGQTATGLSIGTPLFMAPELHLGERATTASDLYAVGCLLWMLVAGRAPYGGTTPYSVIQGHLSGPVPQFAAVGSEAVDAVLRRAMAKDPRARHASAAELRDELAAARRGLAARPPAGPPIGAPPTVAVRPTSYPPSYAPAYAASSGSPGGRPTPGRSRAWLVAIVAVVLVLVAGGVVWAVTRDADPSDEADPTRSPSRSRSASDEVSTATRPTASFTEVPPAPVSPSSTAADPTTSPRPGLSATFGPGCADLPASGPGSIESAASDPVATWLSTTPLALATTTAYASIDGLVDTVNAAADLTVLVPVDSAWAQLPNGTLKKLLSDTDIDGSLARVLLTQVLVGRLDAAGAAGEQPNINGTSVTIVGDASGMTVTDGVSTASVLCGGIETANATVYLIDTVLTGGAG